MPEQPETCHDQKRKKIIEIMSHQDCSGEVRTIIADCLTTPALSIQKEFELQSAIKREGTLATSARAELVRCHKPIAIIVAWNYRKYGASFEQLLDAAMRGLESAAIALNTHSFYFTAEKAAEGSVLDELDSCGIKTVSISELAQLIAQGKKEETKQIMALLSPLEQQMLESKYGSLWGIRVGSRGTCDFFEEAAAIALRKLRRPNQ